MICALLLAACTDSSCDPDVNPDCEGPIASDTGEPDPEPTCEEAPERFADIQGTLAEVQTVARVSWETPTAGLGHVVFTFGEGEVTTPETPSATTHDALLLGIPAGTEVRWRPVTTDADGVWCGPEQTLVTGPLPASLPELTLSELDAERASGAFVPVSLLARETRGVYTAILDGLGRYVWFHNQPEFNYRVMLSADRQSILSNTQPGTSEGMGTILRTALTGELLDTVEIPGGHTDFAELPDGTLATLAWELRTYEDGTRRILGDRLVEIATDGTQTEIWSVFDALEPDLSVVYESGWDDPESGNEDWSHANGLSYYPAQDAYFITFYRFDAVARISRTTGELDWMLSPRDGTFTSTSEPFPISNPHSVRALDGDSLLVLNRGWFAPGECSEAVEMTVDPEAQTVTRDWTYATDDCLQVVALGDAHRLENGNTLVAWSFSGQLDEVTPEGDVVWRVNTGLGEAFGFPEPVMSLY